MGQFTLFTGTVTGMAGSMIAALDSILLNVGWTKPAGLMGTNQAAYLSASTVATPVYMAVNDNAPATGSATEAWAYGYEAMSGPMTGTNPFPLTAQGAPSASYGYAIRKSATANSTARTYFAYADAGTLYLFIATGDVAGAYYAYAFGEFDSTKAADAYCNLHIGRSGGSTGTGLYDALDVISSSYAGTPAYVQWNGVLQRNYNGVAGSVYGARMPDAVPYYWSAQRFMGQGLLPYPNPTDSRVYVAAVRLMEINGAGNSCVGYRGTMRGLWCSCHSVASFNDGDTFSGTGTLASKTFRCIKTSGNNGLYWIETSPTLSTP